MECLLNHIVCLCYAAFICTLVLFPDKEVMKLSGNEIENLFNIDCLFFLLIPYPAAF